MLVIRSVLIILTCLGLTSCSSSTHIVRDSDGRIKEVRSFGNVETEVIEGDTTWKQSTKMQPIELPDIEIGDVEGL